MFIRSEANPDGVRISPKFSVNNKGNYNRYGSSDLKFGKHIGVMSIKELGITDMVWKHEEILELLSMYHKADVKTIQDIQSKKDTGECQNCESQFTDKIREHLTRLEIEQRSPRMEKKADKSRQVSLLQEESS